MVLSGSLANFTLKQKEIFLVKMEVVGREKSKSKSWMGDLKEIINIKKSLYKLKSRIEIKLSCY